MIKQFKIWRIRCRADKRIKEIVASLDAEMAKTALDPIQLYGKAARMLSIIKQIKSIRYQSAQMIADIKDPERVKNRRTLTIEESLGEIKSHGVFGNVRVIRAKDGKIDAEQIRKAVQDGTKG